MPIITRFLDTLKSSAALKMEAYMGTSGYVAGTLYLIQVLYSSFVYGILIMTGSSGKHVSCFISGTYFELLCLVCHAKKSSHESMERVNYNLDPDM